MKDLTLNDSKFKDENGDATELEELEILENDCLRPSHTIPGTPDRYSGR